MKDSKAKSKKPKPKSIYSSTHSMIQAAQSGDLQAQHNLGACYATGDWDGPKDETEAIKWYTKAAVSGHAESQYDLGFMLILGEGTEKDITTGIWWMEQAVKNGDRHAARVLSDIYREGLFGVDSDSGKATFWNEGSGSLKAGI